MKDDQKAKELYEKLQELLNSDPLPRVAIDQLVQDILAVENRRAAVYLKELQSREPLLTPEQRKILARAEAFFAGKDA